MNQTEYAYAIHALTLKVEFQFSENLTNFKINKNKIECVLCQTLRNIYRA